MPGTVSQNLHIINPNESQPPRGLRHDFSTAPETEMCEEIVKRSLAPFYLSARSEALLSSSQSAYTSRNVSSYGSCRIASSKAVPVDIASLPSASLLLARPSNGDGGCHAADVRPAPMPGTLRPGGTPAAPVSRAVLQVPDS